MGLEYYTKRRESYSRTNEINTEFNTVFYFSCLVACYSNYVNYETSSQSGTIWLSTFALNFITIFCHYAIAVYQLILIYCAARIILRRKTSRKDTLRVLNWLSLACKRLLVNAF